VLVVKWLGRVQPGSLTRSDHGTIWGEVWRQFGDEGFPEKHWSDLPNLDPRDVGDEYAYKVGGQYVFPTKTTVNALWERTKRKIPSDLDFQNERMLTELTERSKRATLLAKMGEHLQSCISKDEVFSAALGFAPKIFPAARIWTCLVHSTPRGQGSTKS